MLLRIEFSSIRNLKVNKMHHIFIVNHVEDILLEKQDNADIRIDRSKAINYKLSSNKLCQIDKARHIWGKILNYTTGKQKDGNISYLNFLYGEETSFCCYWRAKEPETSSESMSSKPTWLKIYCKKMKIKKNKIADKRRLDILM